MTRPNILWVVTTQWRAQARECSQALPGTSSEVAGDFNARTPGLEALARRGTDYLEAVTPHPFGPFARAALLTGVPCPTNGVCGYFDPLPAGSRTVATELASLGYETAHFGSWHLGPRDPATPVVGEAPAQAIVPEAHRGGFRFWEGFGGGFQLNDPWLHGTRLPTPTRFIGYQSDVLAAHALAWWRERSTGGRPLFCVVAMEPPHPPYAASSAGIAPMAPHSISLRQNVPRGGEVEARARRELSGYYAHIEATDRSIARLVAGVLEDRPWPLPGAGATDDPAPVAIVVASLHGDQHGSQGVFRKGWPYEESVRVPLVVFHPDESPRRDASPLSLVNLPGMAQAWADGQTWKPPHGPAFLSMPSVPPFADQCDRTWRAVRTPTRKLVLNPDGSPWRLYDLENDPFEENDLCASPAHAREREALHGHLRSGD